MVSNRFGHENTKKNYRSVALIFSGCNRTFFPTAFHETLLYVAPKLAKKISKCGAAFNQKPTEIQAWTPRSPFLCSQVPLDRSMVAQGAKVDATGRPNDTLGAAKLATFAPKITVNCKTLGIETTTGHQRTSTNFSREIWKNLQTATSQSKGAGGMDKASR